MHAPAVPPGSLIDNDATGGTDNDRNVEIGAIDIERLSSVEDAGLRRILAEITALRPAH